MCVVSNGAGTGGCGGGVPQRQNNAERCNIDGVMPARLTAVQRGPADDRPSGSDVDRSPPSDTGDDRRGSLPVRQTSSVDDGGVRTMNSRATERGAAASRLSPAAR